MTRDLLTLVTTWAEAWHKYHDAKPVSETDDLIVIIAESAEWRDLVAKERALLNAVSPQPIQ